MTRPLAGRLACMTLRSTHSGKRHRSHGAAYSQRGCQLDFLTLFFLLQPTKLARAYSCLVASLFVRRSLTYYSVLTLNHVFTLCTHTSDQHSSITQAQLPTPVITCVSLVHTSKCACTWTSPANQRVPISHHCELPLNYHLL